MIHIDDLVRSRLQGGEEKERAGSWMAMRDLLDKEMPAVVAAGSNRRLYGLLLLLLIGTSVTVGGYQIATHSNGNGTADLNRTLLASVVMHAAAPEMATRRTETANTSDKISSGANSNYTKSDYTQNTAAGSAGKNLVGSTNKIPDNTPATHSTVGIAAPNPVGSHRNTAGMPDQTAHTIPATSNVTHSLASGNVAAAAIAVVTPAGKGSNAPLTAGSMAPAAMNGSQVVTPDGLRLLLRRDSVQRIEIVQHRLRSMSENPTTPVILTNDTISMAMMATYRPVAPAIIPVVAATTQPAAMHRSKPLMASSRISPVSAPQAAAKAIDPAKDARVSSGTGFMQAAFNPAAAIASPASGEAGNNSGSLASTVAARHSWWSAEHVNEMINHMKFKMGGIEWYGGVEGGINASFGNGGSLGGFQCALTALVVINDMLSINTGLYYYQRYNTGSTVHDNYVDVDQNNVHYTPVIINNMSYNRYSWAEDSIDHHFNYDVMRTLELPVLLRVSPGGRFFGEGGLNFVYGFKTAASEVTNHAEHLKLQTQAYSTTQPDPQFGSTPAVKLDDFGSRLGLGFAVGGGYHFSPAVTLNVRISKTFWDNAKSDGSQKISADIYRLPNMQLSVGYRFSRQKASPQADQ